jgi:hypothetical protein
MAFGLNLQLIDSGGDEAKINNSNVPLPEQQEALTRKMIFSGFKELNARGLLVPANYEAALDRDTDNA